jgi:hypothetical protein
MTFSDLRLQNITTDEHDEMSKTCYRGPLASQCPNKQCLDWRHICNGYYDCEMGEDEKSCLALENENCHTLI